MAILYEFRHLDINWPKGVGPDEIMQKQHDLDMLELLILPNVTILSYREGLNLLAS